LDGVFLFVDLSHDLALKALELVLVLFDSLRAVDDIHVVDAHGHGQDEHHGLAPDGEECDGIHDAL
jgi:hypothetical protein